MKDLGCMQEAVNAYVQAINLHPHVPELYANLASVFKDGGHHDQAIRNYTQVIEGRRGKKGACARSAIPTSLTNRFTM